jgi:Homeodomain-like domain
VEDNETRLRRIGDELAANRKTGADIFQRARDAATEAVEVGISHRRIAELLGVDRMTIRKWVGKR